MPRASILGTGTAKGVAMIESTALDREHNFPVGHIGPVAVLCRSSDHILCSKGDEP